MKRVEAAHRFEVPVEDGFAFITKPDDEEALKNDRLQ